MCQKPSTNIAAIRAADETQDAQAQTGRERRHHGDMDDAANRDSGEEIEP